MKKRRKKAREEYQKAAQETLRLGQKRAQKVYRAFHQNQITWGQMERLLGQPNGMEIIC